MFLAPMFLLLMFPRLASKARRRPRPRAFTKAAAGILGVPASVIERLRVLERQALAHLLVLAAAVPGEPVRSTTRLGAMPQPFLRPLSL
jgi:hypothetical protein